MKQHRLTILFLAAIVSMAVNGQLFHSLGLGVETPSDWVADFQPQMYVEGNILYVCTKQGLYSKDLSKDESEWQLVGFEGIPILDYVRRGEDIFALCFNDQKDIFLLSHDSGQTYEDVTPDDFRSFINREGHTFWYFNQHPTDPDAFLLTSYHGPGMFMTTDFGQTWEKLADYTPDYMGFHPLTPEIIYECGGGGFTDEKTDLRISYDGGQTWQDKTSCFPDYGTLYRMAFHPTDPDKWIVGGKRCLYTTDDGGKTWDTQSLNGDGSISDYYDYNIDWRYAAYDNEDADIIYMAGGHQTQHMKLICSTDGGKTWNRPYLEPIKTSPTEYVFDMKQYGDKLLIYSQSDVYEISKAELIEHKTSVQINETTFPDEYFRNWVLSKDYGKDGILTDEEIAGVTRIYLNIYGKIHSLKGIEYFTELSILGCAGNPLTELDVSKCTKLTYLECFENQLTSLDVSKNTVLTELYCGGGDPLKTLDISNNTELIYLSCQGSKLTTLDVSNNTALETLSCKGNQLTELDVSKNKNLKRLVCSNNQLTKLELNSLPRLESLDCIQNKLERIIVSDCPKLEDILCHNNQIRGEAMDEFIEGLPTVPNGCGHLRVVDTENEQNVMTKAQVAAAKAKGWNPCYKYYAFDSPWYTDYEGIDEPVTFTEGQMATIILPEEPNAGMGKYYRLDRIEEGKIVFEQELHPQAHVPYIIVPNEDFSIDLNTLDLEGCSPDTVSIKVRFEGQAESQSIYFIGSYVSEEHEQQEGCNIQFIDTTPDCSISFSEETGKETFLIGALRAYLTWDDPYNQGGTKGRGDKLEIVLLDYGTSIREIKNEELRMKNDVFDLSGRKIVNGQLQRGIYIENGRKKTAK